MLRYLKFIILIAGLLPGIRFYAQDSLSNYLHLAALYNPGLKSSYNQYLAALEMVPQVGSLPDPEISLGYFVKPKQELMGNQVADIRLMQMFPWFGTLSASKSEATQMAQARFEEFIASRDALFFEIRSLYYQLFQLHKEIQVSQKNLVFLKSLGQMAEVRFKTAGIVSASGSEQKTIKQEPKVTNTGMNSMGNSANSILPGTGMKNSNMNEMPAGKGMTEVLRIQSELKELENNLLYLNDKLKPLTDRFNAYLNRPFFTIINLPDTLQDSDLPENAIALADSILACNPMLKMYEAEQASYASQLEKTKLMGFPMIGLGLDYMLLNPRQGNTGMDNGKDMVMPMITITLPIYRKKYQAMRRESEYKMNSSLEQQKDKFNALRTELDNELAEYKNSRRKEEQYRWQSGLFQQTLEIKVSAYQTSEVDFEEIIKIQQQLLDLEFKQIESLVSTKIFAAKIDYIVSKQIIKDALPLLK